MKLVEVTECCRSVSSQSGRQPQLEPDANVISVKNFFVFFTLGNLWYGIEHVMDGTNLHVSFGSEGF